MSKKNQRTIEYIPDAEEARELEANVFKAPDAQQDYIVVKDIDTAQGLIQDPNPPKSLRGKTIIVAPDGIKLLSEQELIKIPAVIKVISAAHKAGYERALKRVAAGTKTIKSTVSVKSVEQGAANRGYNRAKKELKLLLQQLSTTPERKKG